MICAFLTSAMTSPPSERIKNLMNLEVHYIYNDNPAVQVMSKIICQIISQKYGISEIFTGGFS
jgi:hypothetical protein